MVDSKFDQGSLEAMRRQSRNNAARQLESQRATRQEQPATTAIKPRVMHSKIDKPELPKKAIFLPECPVCSARVENLNKHYAKHHQGRRVPDAADLKDAKQLILEGKCPFCNSRKRPQEFIFEHLADAHNVSNKDAMLRVVMPSRPTFGFQRLESEFNENTNKDQTIPLDGQYLAGQVFRDHGQFGSYPLHDSMDDESLA